MALDQFIHRFRRDLQTRSCGDITKFQKLRGVVDKLVDRWRSLKKLAARDLPEQRADHEVRVTTGARCRSSVAGGAPLDFCLD